jgi:outer membrane protein assembly factor BamB
MNRRSTFVLALIVALATVGAIAIPVAAHDPARFPARIDLPNGWAPEGITAGRGTTVFVGSLATGAIWKGDVRTGLGRAEFVPGVTGNVAVGVEYEARRNRLWVAGGPTGKVRVYNASTGILLQTYSFTGGADGIFLNDLVVTRNAVYVTDSFTKQLDVIPLGRHGRLPAPSDVRTLPLSGDIAWVTGPGQFNANGIAARNGWLILVQSNTGKLFRVNRATGVTRAIDLGGTSVGFGDGLELHGRTLYVVRNQLNTVAVYRLGDRLRSARFVGNLPSAGLAIPTTAAFQSGRLWAVNARFGTPVTPDTEYWITRLPARP